MPGRAEPQLEHDERISFFDEIGIGDVALVGQTLPSVDRDSEMVAFDYDESEPGVLELCRMAIAAIEAELAR
jgi:pyruvate,water dikinase